MTIADVVTEIGYRMDDPELYTYKNSGTNANYDGRAKRAFTRAMNTIIEKKDYQLQDVFGLVTEAQITPTVDAITSLYTYAITGSIQNVFTVYGLEKTLVFVDPSSIEKSRFDFAEGNTVYYTIIGNKIKFFTKTAFKTNKVVLITIDNVDWNGLTTSSGQWRISNYLSYSLISKAIDLAVTQLIQERNSLVQ